MTTDTYARTARTALVTGGSRGLGRALTLDLLLKGWRVITDGRNSDTLDRLRAQAPNPNALHTVPGDVADASHRADLIDEVARWQGLDLLVNNASLLGPSPQPTLVDYPLGTLAQVYAVNVFAPLALTQLALPHLEQRAGRIINISSDAAIEQYEGWGGLRILEGSAGPAQQHPCRRASRTADLCLRSRGHAYGHARRGLSR